MAAVVLVGAVVIGLNLAGGDDPEADPANPEPSTSPSDGPDGQRLGVRPHAGCR